MSVVPFRGQKYSALKKQALSSGQLFEDPEFARNERTLFYESNAAAAAGIEWKRPKVCSCLCNNLLFHSLTVFAKTYLQLPSVL